MKRMIAAGLALVLSVGALSACKATSIFDQEEDTSIDCAIQVGDQKISEQDYKAQMETYKELMLSQEDAEDTADFWAAESEEEGMNVSDYLLQQVNESLIREKLYVEQFDVLKLSFTEREQATFDSAKADLGAGVATLVDLAKKSKVLNYYFGAEGTVRPLDEQDIKDYYNVHNLCIKRIIINKQDAEGNPYPKEKLAEQDARAQAAYDHAVAESEQDRFDDLIAKYSDDAEQGQTENRIVYNEDSISDSAMFREIEGLEFGEVMRYELEEAYLVIKRYDATGEGIFTATDMVSTMETIRADELDELMAEWRSAADVRINTDIIEKYRPEKLGS